MIGIRTDSNVHIATGHIMRCLSIADALKEQGKDCIFITSDYESEFLIQSRGYQYICLNSKWDNLEKEITILEKIIVEYKLDLLLIDSYYATDQYLNDIRKLIRIAYIDDLNAFHYSCDILINYAIYAEKFCYDNYQKDTQLLLGCQYAPLRKQFLNLSRKMIGDKIEHLLILTGGTDTYNFIGNFVKYFVNRKMYLDFKIEVISGKFNVHKEDNEALIKNIENIKIINYTEAIEKNMMKADIVISAGGSTLYELCACGIPTISYSFADNQLNNVKYFHKEDLISYAGDIREGMDKVLENIYSDITGKYRMRGYRVKISERMRNKVDGYGADRIATILKM